MPFDFQPTFQGDLFAVRPLRLDDFDALFVAASDPMIWEQHPDARYRPERFRVFFDARMQAGGALLVTDPSTGEVIGTTSFCDYDPDRSSVEIGWTFLVRSRWGGPTNTELKFGLMRHAFRFVDHVSYMVDLHNHRSQRAVEKIGGIRQEPRENGEGQLRACFTVSKADFQRAALPRKD